MDVFGPSTVGKHHEGEILLGVSPPFADGPSRANISNESSRAKQDASRAMSEARNVSAVVRCLRAQVNAYGKLVEGAKPLREALSMASHKLNIIRMPTPCPGLVHKVLAAHPGALEAVVAKLVGRMDEYVTDARELQAHFDGQYGQAFSHSRLALHLWFHRLQVGAILLQHNEDSCDSDGEAISDSVDVGAACASVLESLDSIEIDLQSRRAALVHCRYLDWLPSSDVNKGQEQELSPMKAVVDIEKVLSLLDVVGAAAARHGDLSLMGKSTKAWRLRALQTKA